jgi:hypothetical protein
MQIKMINSKRREADGMAPLSDDQQRELKKLVAEMFQERRAMFSKYYHEDKMQEALTALAAHAFTEGQRERSKVVRGRMVRSRVSVRIADHGDSSRTN